MPTLWQAKKRSFWKGDGVVNSDKKDDMYMFDCISCLVDNGFKMETFFYQIGGGEDESDDRIFVKNDIYIRFDFYKKQWVKGNRNHLSYVNGFDKNEKTNDLLNLICH